jgi:hypothetical protein
MTANLVTLYEKGAITADHLVAETLSMLDPANPALDLQDLSKELLQRVLKYAQEYRPGKMRTNYGRSPSLEQVQAAKQWIEAKIQRRSGGESGKSLRVQITWLRG